MCNIPWQFHKQILVVIRYPSSSVGLSMAPSVKASVCPFIGPAFGSDNHTRLKEQYTVCIPETAHNV